MPSGPSDFQFQIDPQGTLKRVAKTLAKMPRQIERAQRRALRKLMTWLKKQVLREAAKAAGVTQKALINNLRYKAELVFSKTRQSIEIWIGTNFIPIHRLGVVVWKPLRGKGSRPIIKSGKSKGARVGPSRSTGARVGKKLYEGTWSWGKGSKTGTAVMERTGEFGRIPRGKPIPRNPLEKIDKVYLEIHDDIERAIRMMLPEINRRFETLMLQELNYALNVEAGP